jgi:hypothetical protein
VSLDLALLAHVRRVDPFKSTLSNSDLGEPFPVHPELARSCHNSLSTLEKLQYFGAL